MRFNDLAQVGLHEIEHDVDLVEARSVLRLQQSLDAENVLVLEQALDLELAVRTQREDAMLESFHDLLDGDQIVFATLAFGDLEVARSNDNAIGSVTQHVDDLISLRDVEHSVHDLVLVVVRRGIFGQFLNFRFRLVFSLHVVCVWHKNSK